MASASIDADLLRLPHCSRLNLGSSMNGGVQQLSLHLKQWYSNLCRREINHIRSLGIPKESIKYPLSSPIPESIGERSPSKWDYKRKDPSRRTVIPRRKLTLTRFVWERMANCIYLHIYIDISHPNHDFVSLLQLIDQMCRFELLSVLIRLCQRGKHRQNRLTDDQYVRRYKPQ